MTEEYKICLSEKIDSYKVLKIINSISQTDENVIVYLQEVITRFLMELGIDLSIEASLYKAYEDFMARVKARVKKLDYRETETKKLLYVVCSRAKNNLYLFSEQGRTTQKGSSITING